jgi:glycosyltransferase involved in cell wall biosynthesis
MQEPLVSVKMITYNHAPYIAQAIECVLAQKTNFPFELVIGEDCSTDGTREIVFDYAKRFPDIIRVITSDKNVGMKKNSLRTTEACQGKYIAYCEGDDYWHRDDKLQIQVDYLEARPECGLVCSDYDVYDTITKKRVNGYVKYKGWIVPDHPQITDFLNISAELRVAILTCTVTARKEIVEKIIKADPYLHSEGNFLMGDTQLWAEISTISDVHFMDVSFATHNILAESAANHRDLKKKLRFRISGFNLLIYLCDKYNISTKIKKVHKANLQNYSLQLAFHEKNADLAEEVKKNMTIFTWKEWLRYYGAKNAIIHFLCINLITMRNLIRHKKTRWS